MSFTLRRYFLSTFKDNTLDNVPMISSGGLKSSSLAPESYLFTALPLCPDVLWPNAGVGVGVRRKPLKCEGHPWTAAKSFLQNVLDGVSTYKRLYIKLGTWGYCWVFMILKKNLKYSFSHRFLRKYCLTAPSLTTNLTLISKLRSWTVILLSNEYTACSGLGSGDVV